MQIIIINTHKSGRKRCKSIMCWSGWGERGVMRETMKRGTGRKR